MYFKLVVSYKRQEAARLDNWETGNIAALKTHPKQSGSYYNRVHNSLGQIAGRSIIKPPPPIINVVGLTLVPPGLCVGSQHFAVGSQH